MEQPKPNPEKLRKRVVVLFSFGLLLMAILAAGIGWASGDWLRLSLSWVNWVGGLFLTLVGISLVVWSVSIQYTFGKGTPAPKVPTQRLITLGPYAHTRNPMTLGALLFYTGIGFWMGSGVVVLLSIVVHSALLTFIFIHETKELTERFGQEYLDYKKETPFLFPRLWRGK